MLHLNFTPFPNLTTERLLLRQLNENDENEIFKLRSDERVNKYLSRSKASSVEEAREFITKINKGIQDNQSLYWAITFKEDTKLIGTVCLWNISKENDTAEIGYELIPDYHEKGLMQEALTKVIGFGFENMKLKAIEAYTHPHNDGSTKLLVKNNFKKIRDAGENSEDKEVVYTLMKE